MSTQKTVAYKTCGLLSTKSHPDGPQHFGYVWDGEQMHWTDTFKTKDEAELELVCLKKRLSYECIKTMEDDGFYPERAIIKERQYIESGNTSGIFE